MDSNTYQELAKQIIQLQAENDQLRSQLQLQQKAGFPAAAMNSGQQHDNSTKELASNLANQTIEIKSLQQTISDLKERATAALEREQESAQKLTRSKYTLAELDQLRSRYHHLEAKINDLNERLQQLTLQQLQQQQQAHRIAELESLLAIAEESNEMLRKQSDA